MSVIRSGKGVGGFRAWRAYCRECGGTGRLADWRDCLPCKGNGSVYAGTGESARVSQNVLDNSKAVLSAAINRPRGHTGNHS